METSALQGLFVQPRSGPDPRVAKIDETCNRQGSDGVLYRMLNEKEWARFRTQSEDELRNEQQKSREIKENMYTLSGQLKDGSYQSRSRNISGSSRFVAPQMGTTSRSRKIERGNWTSDLHSLKTGQSGAIKTSDKDYISTIQRLAKNSTDTCRYDTEFEQDGQKAPIIQEFSPAAGGLDVPQHAGQRAVSAVRIMQGKYAQNLQVVERLHAEKQDMAQRMKSLEDAVLRLSQGGAVRDREDHEDLLLQGSDLGVPSYSGYEANEGLQSRFGLGSDVSSGGYSVGRGQEETLSAMDIAQLLNGAGADGNRSEGFQAMDDTHTSGHFNRTKMKGKLQATGQVLTPDFSRPRSAYARSAQTKAQQQQQRPSSAPRGGRGARQPERGSHGNSSRSQSASRSALLSRPRVRATSGLSASLQADADRYIQRRRLYDERERLKQLEQQQYEQKLRERQLRASLNGAEFADLQRRQQLAFEAKEARLQRLRQEEQDREDRERQERRAKMEANKQSMTLVTKNQLSWRELQEVEEAKRRDRIERRKQELTMMSAMPSCIAESMSKGKKAAPGGCDSDTRTGSRGGGDFKAEDPSKVTAKLARQQKAWDIKLEREKERQRERRAAKVLATTSSSAATASGNSSETVGTEGNDLCLSKTPMELRQMRYQARREQHARDKAEKEAEELRRRQQEETKKRERLLAAKVPEGKLTQAARLKAQKVQRDLQQRARADQRAISSARRKEEAEKAHAVVLKTIISERENELRSSHGGYMELSAVERDAAAATAAAVAREEYRQKLRSNRQRLEERLKERPTLIERHDERVAVRNAANAALHTVASAAAQGYSGTGTSDSALHHSRRATRTARVHEKEFSADDNDLFDPKEKILLGLTKS